MNAALIIELLTQLPGLISTATQLAAEFKATASASDQATVDALLAQIVTASQATIVQAETDLDTAAKA